MHPAQVAIGKSEGESEGLSMCTRKSVHTANPVRAVARTATAAHCAEAVRQCVVVRGTSARPSMLQSVPAVTAHQAPHPLHWLPGSCALSFLCSGSVCGGGQCGQVNVCVQGAHCHSGLSMP
jgi:hypothetical protein